MLSLLRAAWKLDADKGIARIKKLAGWLDQKYPQAGASLEECFTINRLDTEASFSDHAFVETE